MVGIPLITMCVSFKVSATAIRASSCVNLSNLFNASSMSFLPTSFLTFFWTQISQQFYIAESDALARLCFISLVAMAKMFSTSIIIFTIISVIASVGGTAE